MFLRLYLTKNKILFWILGTPVGFPRPAVSCLSWCKTLQICISKWIFACWGLRWTLILCYLVYSTKMFLSKKYIFFWKLLWIQLKVSALTQVKLCQYLSCPIWPQFKILINILPNMFVFLPSTLINLKLQITKVLWKASSSILITLSLSIREHFQDFFKLIRNICQ